MSDGEGGMQDLFNGDEEHDRAIADIILRGLLLNVGSHVAERVSFA